MSAQTKKGVAAAKTSGLIVGETAHGRRLHLHVKTWGIIAGSIVLVVVLSFTAVHFLHRSKPTQTAQPPAKKQSIAYQATGLGLTGQYAAGQKLLDDSIAKTSSKTLQGQYYEEKSHLSYESKDYANGLKYAQKAESLHPTTNSAGWIGKNAQMLKEDTLALKYYQLELQRFGKPINPSDTAEIRAAITALGGTPDVTQ